MLAAQGSTIATRTQTQIAASVAHVASFSPWVIDFGAFIHMTGTSGHLTNLSPSGHLSCVTLSDGFTFSIHCLGIANSGPSLSLYFVLYAPKFSFNLMSVSCITKSFNCSITFFATHCVF